MIAIVKTGGKQYLVKPNEVVRIEKLPEDVGETVNLETLFIADEVAGTINVGMPEVTGKAVTASIVKHGRGRKVLVTKFKNKTRHRRTNGHRQHFTDVKIEQIG